MCPWHTGPLTDDRSGLSKLAHSFPTEQQQKKILVKPPYLLDTEGSASSSLTDGLRQWPWLGVRLRRGSAALFFNPQKDTYTLQIAFGRYYNKKLLISSFNLREKSPIFCGDKTPQEPPVTHPLGITSFNKTCLERIREGFLRTLHSGEESWLGGGCVECLEEYIPHWPSWRGLPGSHSGLWLNKCGTVGRILGETLPERIWYQRLPHDGWGEPGRQGLGECSTDTGTQPGISSYFNFWKFPEKSDTRKTSPLLL